MPSRVAFARATPDARAAAPSAALRAAAAPAPAQPLVPSITATKVDAFADPDGDNKAEPGQTITYTVTITNNGTDAANVNFSDTIDPNTTLVPGSVSTQPIASNDSYNVLGNVRIQPNAASGLLANDCDPDNGPGCSSGGLTASGPATSAQGGNVAVNPDGSFSYNPPAGYEGPDSFTYTVSDGTNSDTATANFTVSEMVWFVDNTAPAGGDGRLTNPYNSLAPLGGADLDESFDFIFVYEGAGSYGGGIALEDDQRLVGQGTGLDAALGLFSVTAPAHSDARPAATTNPTLANSGGNVIALANNNAVLYVNAAASAAAAAAISGGAVGGNSVSNTGASASGSALGVSLANSGTFTMTNSTVSSNSSGAAVLISGGAAAISFNNTDVSQNGGRVVDIQSRTGGLVSFDAASSVAGTNGTTDAVSLLSNSGTVTFNGPVTLNTNAPGVRGLVADSGTVNLTSGGNTVSSTGGAAVDLENLTAGIQFATTFSTNSTGRGLRVVSVSGTASFGNTAVNNSANTGVLVTDNAAAVTFADLDIAPASGARALHAVDNTGRLTSTSGVVVTANAVAVEITSGASSPLNVQLTSVSATSATSGIVLTNTTSAGSPGGFNVNGDGTNARNGSGGTITATTDDGVRLTNVAGARLRSMNLTNNGDTVSGLLATNESAAGEHAVEADASSGVELSGVLIQNPAASGFLGLNLTGTNRVNSDSLVTAVNNANTHGVYVVNTNVNQTLFEINDSDFTNSATGASFVLIANNGTANMTVEVENGCVFEGLNSQALTLSGGQSVATAGTLTSVVNGNTFRNAAAGAENNVAALVNFGALHNATIESNLFDNIAESGLVANTSIIRTQNSGGRMTAVVKNNTVQNINYAAAGRHAIGHIFEPALYNAANFSDLKIEGNTITNVTYSAVNTNREVIHIDYRATASGGDIKILGNNWNMPSPGTQEGMELRFRQTNASTVDLLVDNNGNGTGAVFNTTTRYIDIDAEQAATVNATVTNNNLNNSGTTAQRILDFETETATASMCVNVSGNTLPAAGASTIRLAQTAGTMTVTQASAAAVSAANGGATVTVVGTPTFGVPPCTLPSNASLDVPALFERAPQAARAETAAVREPEQTGRAAGGFAAAFDKTPRGLANSERGQVLGWGEEPAKTVRTAAPLAALAGETINIPIGTLRAGDSVTITFQVTVADPFPTNVNPKQVSNQGTVTADGGISVLTDDPSEPGATDPTVTPILTPPVVSVNDATVTEPASGSTDMLFTVTLSNTYTQTVTVNYQTANGGANPATAGTDYTTSSGTVTFAAGETVKTVAVAVLADGTPAEGDETFLVNLSAPTNATIGDGQATGTITDESEASPVIISELRERGPNGPNDEFVELLNTTDADITVTSSDGSNSGWALVKRGADCDADPVVVGVVPEGTVIPARGNFLFTGSTYSLAGYPAGNGTTATGDAALSSDIGDNSNLGLFTTATLANISSANRLDAVGFGANTGGNCDLLREGTNIPALVPFSIDSSFVRKVEKGLTVDTNDNAADFIFVDTNGTSAGAGQRLGAPGPENLSSPRGPVPCSAAAGDDKFGRELIDPAVSAASAPNVARDNTSDPVNNSTFGTIDFRRTWTNNTGAPVTRLRFRVTDQSTFPSPSGTADLRARTSSPVIVSTTSGNKTVLGTTLEQPPAQPNGGGINSSLSAGTITLATPLANGASVNLRFLFGVQQTGSYDIGVVLESLPASGKDFWRLTGHTETGGHTDAGCNRPPVADAGPDQTVECSNGQASVTLDGSGSTDPDGDTPLTYAWTEGATSLGTGQTLNVTLPVGSHVITLTVTDPAGDSSQDTVTINVVDTTAPQVTAPPDVTVYTGPGATSCSATVSDAQLGTATASDSCEGPLTPQRTGVPAGNNFPVGTTQVTYTATDAAGNIGSDIQNVTVIDNTPPVVTPPANINTSADPDSCSADIDPGQATASDNCSVGTPVGTRSDNQPLDAPYPVGTTTITWTATDVNGNQATAQQTVTVTDNQAPTVSASVAVTTMGPPFNHALINVGLSATASDNCGTVTTQVFVYSDEDDGPAPHSPDAVNIGLGTLKLRRERDGGGNGRVYLIVVKATDSSGNTSVSVKTVTVPASNSAGDHASVAAQAAAAAAFAASNNGNPPAGYFVVGS